MGEFVEIGAGGISLELTGVFCATAWVFTRCSSPVHPTTTIPTAVAAVG